MTGGGEEVRSRDCKLNDILGSFAHDTNYGADDKLKNFMSLLFSLAKFSDDTSLRQ